MFCTYEDKFKIVVIMKYNRFNRILLAVDDSPCTEKAIAYAKDLAQEFNSILALITVIPPTSPASYGADPLLGQQPIIVPEVAQIQLEATQKYLNELAAEFNSANEVFTFNKVGNIRDEILETATQWAADLIIIGSNGRTGFEHFISGSVSESVIRKASCPVLVVPNKCD
ncbi:Universal stress protein family protein [Sphingobacterium psychroaquaticum]|uniref:Universal stress protein family protein n=2 Tax=Sphingobacterium psychroaquaticum TaxID=561061 RepID=A0A1X7JNR0_9SPHI|nr:Universal stress protein family protein [Sphingobacterium psychroaquaticum]